MCIDAVCACACVCVATSCCDSEFSCRFIYEHLLLLSCKIQTSSWPISTVLTVREVKKERGREGRSTEIREIEHTQ